MRNASFALETDWDLIVTDGGCGIGRTDATIVAVRKRGRGYRPRRAQEIIA